MKYSRSGRIHLLGGLGIALLLVGCGEQSNAQIDAASQLSGPEATGLAASAEAVPHEEEALSEIEVYWREFASRIAMKDNIHQGFEELPLAYYREGLHNADPLIRWYCVYKITDYAAELSEADRQAVASLLEDPDTDVVQAARFANELLNRTYEGDAFARTADGEKIAYYKYREARYNDGRVYLVSNGDEPELIFTEPSIHDLKFSPDGRYLYVGNSGRIWEAIQIYDVATNEWMRLHHPINSLIAVTDSPYRAFDESKVDPVYQWVHLQKWSPDGERFLFYYYFRYDEQDHDGYAVFDMRSNVIGRIMPITEEYPDPAAEFVW